jgi:excisionase family DNA binding protein
MGAVDTWHESELLYPAEYADELRVSLSSVRRWIRQGKVEHVRTPGGQVRIPRGALPRVQRGRLEHGHNGMDRRAQ